MPWVALLPALDPTTMGWQARDWYLGSHKAQLFDRNGNAGPTIWLDGRIVGGWAIRDAGEVVTGLLEDVGREAETRHRRGGGSPGRPARSASASRPASRPRTTARCWADGRAHRGDLVRIV